MAHRRLVLNDLLRIRHERWRVVRSDTFENCSVLTVAGCDAANRGRTSRFLLPFEAFDVLPPFAVPRSVTRRGWRRLLRRALATATPSPHALRSAVHARFTPMRFQLEPALAYLRGDATRLLIADAVGLGKTIQAGLIVSELVERSPDHRALIVVPGGLRDQWRDELRAHFGLEADVLDAGGLWRRAAELPPGANPWTASRIVITSIDFVKRPEVLRALEPLVWDLVIFDEAHVLAGRSDRHTAGAALARRGRAVVLLTATPHSGEDEAFERLCALGDIAGKFPLTIFRRTRSELGPIAARRSRWLRLGCSLAGSTLRSALVQYASDVWRESPSAGGRLAVIVLLKRAASSATALARSLAHRRRLLAHESTDASSGCANEEQMQLPLVPDDDEEPTTELSAPGLRDAERESAAIDNLIGLAATASGTDRKVDTLRRLLTRTRESVIVFTQYRDTLEALSTALEDYSTVAIHGGMSARERAQAARAFTDGDARILLATDAASEGLNLHQRCRLIISFDLPWTPLRIEQRIGRVDRIGQRRRVHAWQMLAADTYEEVVASRVRARTERANVALNTLERDDERQAIADILGVPSPSPPRVLQPHGSAMCSPLMADEEVSRIRWAREALRHASRADGTRAVVPSRVRPGGMRVAMVFKATFADHAGHHEWSTIVGGAWHTPHSGAIRPDDWLHLASEAGATVADAAARLFAADQHLWRRAAARALRRDRALACRLRADRARLSAALIQPDLFSRRAERLLTPQLHVLDESLRRLRVAGDAIRAVRHVELDSISLLFAGPVAD